MYQVWSKMEIIWVFLRDINQRLKREITMGEFYYIFITQLSGVKVHKFWQNHPLISNVKKCQILSESIKFSFSILFLSAFKVLRSEFRSVFLQNLIIQISSRFLQVSIQTKIAHIGTILPGHKIKNWNNLIFD